MSKLSKLCEVVYHSTRLDQTKVFILLYGFMGTLDQKAIATGETNAPYERVFVIYREN